MILGSSGKNFIILSILVLVALTMCKDWYDFYCCGAVDSCLSASGVPQLFFKFAMSALLTGLAFLVAKDSFSPRDGFFLRIAFVFSLLADFGFSMLKLLCPENISLLCGIGFFMVFQVILIYRHSRESESDRNFPKAYLLLAASLIVAFVMGATGVLSLISSVVLSYAVFVITSVIVGVLAPRRGYFPASNAKFVCRGMLAFLVGDFLVGLTMLSGEDHGAVQLISSLANNFIWLVYVPAQLMLIRATAKPQA